MSDDDAESVSALPSVGCWARMRAEMKRGSQKASAKKLTDSQGTPWEPSGFARKIAPAGLISADLRRLISWPFGQISTGQARIMAASCALAVCAVIATGCGSPGERATGGAGGAKTAPVRGGQAVASVRVEPRSFN